MKDLGAYDPGKKKKKRKGRMPPALRRYWAKHRRKGRKYDPGRPVWRGPRGGLYFRGPKKKRYDPGRRSRVRGAVSKLSSRLMKFDWLAGLAALFFAATQKNPGSLANKGSAFIEILKAPQDHLPKTPEEYVERLKASTPLKVGLAALIYGHIAPLLGLGRYLKFTAPARALGTAVVVGSAVGAAIDPAPSELGAPSAIGQAQQQKPYAVEVYGLHDWRDLEPLIVDGERKI